MLAKPLRGKSTAENQLEKLGYWVWLRGTQHLGLTSADLEGWDPPKVQRASGGTATVTTTLQFRLKYDDVPDRPLPVVVDLQVEDGYWRIRNARIDPPPAWFYFLQQRAKEIGDSPLELVDLATVADTYRPPPPR
jgi:hypothetical protein